VAPHLGRHRPSHRHLRPLEGDKLKTLAP
jgi:hypothetical protein